MDKSETFIKMSEKAEKIQNKAPICMADTGRFFVVHQGDDVWYRQGAIFNDEGFCINNVKLIWLPSQAQLQGMIENTGAWDLVIRFYAFCVGFYDIESLQISRKPVSIFTSMEQLWLAFVMKELWNKLWDGEKWIKQK